MSMWIFKIYFWHQMKPTEILHIKPKSHWQTSETGVPVPTRSWGTLQLPVAFTKVALALCKELCPLHIFSAISLRNSSWKKNPWNFLIIWRNSYNPYDDNSNGEKHQRNKRNSHILALFCVFFLGTCSLFPTPCRNVLKGHS